LKIGLKVARLKVEDLNKGEAAFNLLNYPNP